MDALVDLPLKLASCFLALAVIFFTLGGGPPAPPSLPQKVTRTSPLGEYLRAIHNAEGSRSSPYTARAALTAMQRRKARVL